MTAKNLGGRPQAYLGALEERVVEVQAIAAELIPHDAREWARLDAMDACDREMAKATDAGDLVMVRYYSVELAKLHRAARLADIEENRRHRAILRADVAS